MTEKSQLILMAEYNQLMNQRMFDACKDLSSNLLAEDKGAFFKSIIGTLNHIMIGDILWLKRFSIHSIIYTSLKPLHDMKNPEGLSVILFDEMNIFGKKRAAIDNIILKWCYELNGSDLDKPLLYTNFKGEEHSKRLGSLILHLFLHQIHHRGQITTLLSQEGIDFGETDLPEIISDENYE